jgi:hypothetical protein
MATRLQRTSRPELAAISVDAVHRGGHLRRPRGTDRMGQAVGVHRGEPHRANGHGGTPGASARPHRRTERGRLRHLLPGRRRCGRARLAAAFTAPRRLRCHRCDRRRHAQCAADRDRARIGARGRHGGRRRHRQSSGRRRSSAVARLASGPGWPSPSHRRRD